MLGTWPKWYFVSVTVTWDWRVTRYFMVLVTVLWYSILLAYSEVSAERVDYNSTIKHPFLVFVIKQSCGQKKFLKTKETRTTTSGREDFKIEKLIQICDLSLHGGKMIKSNCNGRYPPKPHYVTVMLQFFKMWLDTPRYTKIVPCYSTEHKVPRCKWWQIKQTLVGIKLNWMQIKE